MKSTFLLICLAFAAESKSKSIEPGQDAPASSPDAADDFMGQEAGQVRDQNGLKTKLVWCPPGMFLMGSPTSERDRDSDELQTSVTLTKGFWLGQFEVTQSEWKQVMQTEPWKGQKYAKAGADYPAVFVSWYDVADFCRKLTGQEREAGRLSKDWEYALPTEAQWEWACRARTTTRYSFGDDTSLLRDYAWFDDNAGKAGEQYAHRVGQKRANPWNLFDMHGNVWEWCRDMYTEKLPGGRDPDVQPEAETDATLRVFRGGGWFLDASCCRAGSRTWNPPDNRSFNFGFRVALTSRLAE